MENPFLEESHDLLVLDIKNMMNVSVVETVRKIKSWIGAIQEICGREIAAVAEANNRNSV